ncbi:MAG TPA: GH92 family glycosyl hydrolase, partial [Polyangiaceae bacterium]|nr:GH92 family glycosyl hydrolase [Polyangiaceae bacterium]
SNPAANPVPESTPPPALLPDLTGYVDPFIGTDDSDSPFPVPGGAGGSTYPGAVVPFGMVQLSPDTPTASPSGYRYGDTSIESFSLTHFDGAGCPNNEDLPFLPFVEPLDSSPATDWESYASRYDKASEAASPGYYAVTLESGVKVELTTTTRTGMLRLAYPAATAPRFLIHAGRSATGSRTGSVEVVGSTRIRGTATAGGFCGTEPTFPIYFVLEFERPFAEFGTWTGPTLSAGSATAGGRDVGAFVTFDPQQGSLVQAKIGISFVSIANAEANLQAENAGWSFDAVRESARTRWNEVLHRVEVSGGADEDLAKFYTALYHVFQSPNVASDVNGQYLGFDRAVHTATDFTLYQNYSGWDMIRSWTHLVSALAPEAPDILRSMVLDGEQGGLLPFWTHQNVETRVMVGDPGTVNVANAYAMGVRGFDAPAALALMTRSANEPAATHRAGLEQWLELHYLDNASVSLEYAMADFAIARFADALGEASLRDEYMTRSAWWQESWDPLSGYIRPRAVPALAGFAAARIYEVEVFGPDEPETNLAPLGTATASGECNPSENAQQAINGSWTGGTGDKWCDNSSSEKQWQLDLGSARSIERVVVHHAEDGGEPAEWNTQAFSLDVSTDGTDFTRVALVTDNSAPVTTHTFPAVTARYLRIVIDAPIQSSAEVGDVTCEPFAAASSCGFIEGNASQYVWMVPHDLEGLFTRMGGHAAAITRLEEHFSELNAGTERAFFYIGNEPEHATPWAFNFAQAPWKTQAVVRRIVNEEFNTRAGGLPGNDDLGATSAWLVWAYLGLYPVIPGTDVLVLNGPRFEKSVLHLANGQSLTINGAGAADDAPFIQTLNVNGRPTTQSWLRYADLGDASLDFTLGRSPNAGWGASAADRPPSFAP